MKLPTKSNNKIVLEKTQNNAVLIKRGLTPKEEALVDYKANKGKMTDKQRLDRIEEILGL